MADRIADARDAGGKLTLATLWWTAAALVFLSPVWIESDAYRYAIGPFLLFGLFTYFRSPSPRLALGLIGWTCIAWSAYVALRFALATGPNAVEGGSAEGLYLFPLVFSTFGYAWMTLETRLWRLPDLSMAISLVLLLATVDIPTVLAGLRTSFLIQNNTIHASVAAGFITIASLGYLHHALRAPSPSLRARTLRIVLALAVIALCLIGIFGAKSKGVWLALGIALPLQAAWIISRVPRRFAWPGAIFSATLAYAALYMAADGLLAEAGPHIEAIGVLLADIDREGLTPALQTAVGDLTVPLSMRERLALWGNALLVWQEAPTLGWGLHWEEQWNNSPFGEMHYNLIHNGYLEIAIRYGLVGLAVFAAIFFAFCRWTIRAWRRGLATEAEIQVYFCSIIFFALTLLSNSNNRLAIGEMFILAAAGFGFRCWFALQEAERPNEHPPALAGDMKPVA